ncbi:MAG: UbiX family flavin prenyltransferase [Candidatus Hodarchaeales archaeon]
MPKTRLIVGISGASGVIYGARLVEALATSSVEVHLVISKWAGTILEQEMRVDHDHLKEQAPFSYDPLDMGAAISSSSFLTNGMVICPASVKTVSQIASADTSNLISRAADITLKMGRKLVLCIRETPLSAPCLKNLHTLASYGAIIMPLSPAFYHIPTSIEDIVSFMVGKILDVFQIPNEMYSRWK